MWLTQLTRSFGLRTLRDTPPRLGTTGRGFTPRLTALEDRTVPSAFTVTNLLDTGSGSLRAAITTAQDAAHPGADTITFKNGLKGTITLGTELKITDDLTITGPGAGKLTVSGGGTTRVFNISGSGTEASMTGLTIANGRASAPAGVAYAGGLLNDGATVSTDRTVFTGNTATGDGAGGGAVANLHGAHFTADHTDFRDNSARASGSNFANGGAVYDDQNAVVTITHGTFGGNGSRGGNANGGAIGHYGGSVLTLRDCDFDANSVQAPAGQIPGFFRDAAGGAIESDRSQAGFDKGSFPAPTLDIRSSTFTSNTASVAGQSPAGTDPVNAEGGAIALEDAAVATVRGSTFLGNSAQGGNGGTDGAGGAGSGGAVFVLSGKLDVYDTQFSGNRAEGGAGGVGAAGGQGIGGALGCDVLFGATVGSAVTVRDSAFAGNRAVGGRGGVGVDGAWAFGGAISNTSSDLTVRDSAFVSNAATGGAGGANGGSGGFGLGGAIAVSSLDPPYPVPTTDLTACLLLGNSAVGGQGAVGGGGGVGAGGAILNVVGELHIRESAIFANQAIGGRGGVGGDGGLGLGGGVFNGFADFGGTATISNGVISGNQATGGAGGGGGGNGGLGLGGGLYNGGGGSTTLHGVGVVINRAGGGAGNGGVAGTGIGGGVYNDADSGSTVAGDLWLVFGNSADESPNLFGNS